MSARKFKILMVEDCENLLKANAKLLAADDYVIHTAVSIAQARAAIKNEMPDLAILDIKLPDGNGRDFAIELRKISRTSIIFLTEKTSRDDKSAGLEAGALSYIPKPYDPELFKATVRNIVNDLKNVRRYKDPFLLTPDELAAAKLAIKGEQNKSIATKLFTTERCIKGRLNATYKKLKIKGGDSEKRKHLAVVLGGYL